jgi:hypothetical protein
VYFCSDEREEKATLDVAGQWPFLTSSSHPTHFPFFLLSRSALSIKCATVKQHTLVDTNLNLMVVHWTTQ